MTKMARRSFNKPLRQCHQVYSTNGKVSILVTTTKDYIILSIQDTGIGITEEELPYIFKRFWRGSETKTDGNGIGLYLCQKLWHYIMDLFW